MTIETLDEASERASEGVSGIETEATIKRARGRRGTINREKQIYRQTRTRSTFSCLLESNVAACIALWPKFTPLSTVKWL